MVYRTIFAVDFDVSEVCCVQPVEGAVRSITEVNRSVPKRACPITSVAICKIREAVTVALPIGKGEIRFTVDFCVRAPGRFTSHELRRNLQSGQIDLQRIVKPAQCV